MAKKEKFYVVWQGKKPGIYTKWKDCKAMIDGFAGAQFKSFESFTEAKAAYNKDFKDVKGKSKTKKTLSEAEKQKYGEPNLYSIAVDAASSGNPGIIEYRGVDT
ncbi:MAG: ribonuclease H family protein, partial [Leeuwenhoekiella sp.]|nr:ribonuclease H family protein [Leeuwenhoekiella sp.]